MPRLVRTVTEVQTNILRFERELQSDSRLVERLSYMHAWYVERNPQGGWAFGPSKFVGYRDNKAGRYLKASSPSGDAHGGTTERVLAEWYQPVDLETRLGRELLEALGRFLARWDQAPRARVRINVPKAALREVHATSGAAGSMSDTRLLHRISADPRICGGRPCIKGTRVRVTDIVDMLAHGATRAEILQDFDYLSDEDITAALYYAARAADHRVIQTA
jgi:uncharacterized protein (DUF433 family)